MWQDSPLARLTSVDLQRLFSASSDLRNSPYVPSDGQGAAAPMDWEQPGEAGKQLEDVMQVICFPWTFSEIFSGLLISHSTRFIK